MANFNFVYNGLGVDIELPVDDYLMFQFDMLDVNDPADFISRLSDSIANVPASPAPPLIILNAMHGNLDENNGWIAPLNSLADCISNKIIVINGRLNNISRDISELKFGLYRVNQFSQFANLIYDRQVKVSGRDATQDINHPKDKKLYWASTKDIYWRRYMLAGLHSNDVIKDSLVNYKCIVSDIPNDINTYAVRTSDESVRQHVISECASMHNVVPLPSLDDTIEVEHTDCKFHLRALVGLSIETFYESPGIFFSEKIFNSIAYKQIFFYVGAQGALEWLRNHRGYNTFDHIIDTSYDSIQDNWERLIAARKSLLDFINQPIEKIAEIYDDCKPLIEQNFEIFRDEGFSNDLYYTIKYHLDNEKAT
jgi:hypothetical protein